MMGNPSNEREAATSEIQHLLTEYLVTPIVAWFDDLYAQVRRRDDRLMTLQVRLKDIPNWSATSLDACMEFLRKRCSFLNEVITALFLHCIKSMAVIKNAHNLAVTVRIPKRATFMHSVMVAAAKEFYENPFVFRRNDRMSKEAIVLRVLQVCAIKALPMKDLLTAYLHTQAPSPTNESEELVVRNVDQRNAPVPAMVEPPPAVGGVPAVILRMKQEAADMGILNSNLNNNELEPEVAQPKEEAPTPKSQEPAPCEDKVIVPSLSSTASLTKGATADLFPKVLLPAHQLGTPGSVRDDQASACSSASTYKLEQPPSILRESDKTVDIVKSIEFERERAAASSAPGRNGRASKGAKKTTPPKKKTEAGSETTAGLSGTSVNVLSKRQQNALLDEILNQTRTREMLTPTFFSDAASKE